MCSRVSALTAIDNRWAYNKMKREAIFSLSAPTERLWRETASLRGERIASRVVAAPVVQRVRSTECAGKEGSQEKKEFRRDPAKEAGSAEHACVWQARKGIGESA